MLLFLIDKREENGGFAFRQKMYFQLFFKAMAFFERCLPNPLLDKYFFRDPSPWSRWIDYADFIISSVFNIFFFFFQVMLPHRVGDLYIYEQPQNLCPSPSPSQTHISLHQSHLTSPRTQTPPHLSLYSPQPNINSIHNNQSHLPPHTQGGMETYDVPRSIPVSTTYDAPRSLLPRFQGQGHGVAPPGSTSANPGPGDWYDVPRAPASLTLFHQQQLTPSSSASSLTMDSMSSSNRY